MKYLLDTHILIWALFSDEKLSQVAYEIINNPKHKIDCSSASVWEIGIKHEKSPDKMPITSQQIAEFCEISRIFTLSITKEHALV